MTNATDKAARLAHQEDVRISNAVLDGIIVYRRPDTDLFRVMVRVHDHNWDCATCWVELFWNIYTGEYWNGESYDNAKSVGDETYVTWGAAPCALRKLALDLRLAAIP